MSRTLGPPFVPSRQSVTASGPLSLRARVDGTMVSAALAKEDLRICLRSTSIVVLTLGCGSVEVGPPSLLGGDTESADQFTPGLIVDLDLAPEVITLTPY